MARTREQPKEKKQTSWLALFVLMIVGAVFGWYVIYVDRGIAIEYEQLDKMTATTNARSMARVELPNNDVPLTVPSWSLFSANNVWMYTSKSRPLAKSYAPTDLVTVDLPHGASDTPIQLNARTAHQLRALFAQATTDDYPLMISSAYRSISDQQKLYDDFVASKGEAMAKEYVALPGTSEHHTGLAVDVTDASDSCAANSDKCNLSSGTAAWLAEHAPDYGFIIRYPSGKQPATGVAYEPWHLRYVGVVMARQATAADMAYDEIVEQIAPGYVRSVAQ